MVSLKTKIKKILETLELKNIDIKTHIFKLKNGEIISLSGLEEMTDDVIKFSEKINPILT